MEVAPDMLAVGIKCPACDRPAKVSPMFVDPNRFGQNRAILCDHGTGRPRKLAEVRNYPYADAEAVQRAINDEHERGSGRTYVIIHWPSEMRRQPQPKDDKP